MDSTPHDSNRASPEPEPKPSGVSDDALTRWATRTAGVIEPVLRWLREHQEQLAAALRAAGFQGLPPNWATLDPLQQQVLLKLLAEDDGTPLAWLPPAHVLASFPDAASSAERDAVLLAHDRPIEVSARELLEQVSAPELAELRSAVTGAWDAYAGGHKSSAQALAAACVTAAVQGDTGLALPQLADLGKELREVQRGAFLRMRKLREAATLSAVAVALRNASHQAGQPGFNRHLTAHSVSASQYTDANSLRGVMLATAMVRELQEARTAPVGPLVGPARLKLRREQIQRFNDE